MLDWKAAHAWLDALAPETRSEAWSQLERAWLQALRRSLGEPYTLRETPSAILLSGLSTPAAAATLNYMEKTLRRVTHVLDGIAVAPEWGKDILIAFQDDETYYRYVSQFYSNEGEFPGSSGTFLNADCGHFVAVEGGLHLIEPVIAHEMTHSCLSHLPLPLWLNEGLAVNTEQRLCGANSRLNAPREMNEKHKAFWGADEIQQFWSGQAFYRTDEGTTLAYNLAQLLVLQFSRDWESFRAFTNQAVGEDSGAQAAATCLGLDLGAVVCALLERPASRAWAPCPELWQVPQDRSDSSRP